MMIINYIKDFIYGARKYPCALFKPLVFLGYFGNEEKHLHQKYFFDELLILGFKRTVWQLVFPNQTAGLIKRIPATDTGVNEYHIRFYEDGTIECELEVDRWSIKHWTGPRHHGESGVKILFGILENELNVFSKEKKLASVIRY